MDTLTLDPIVRLTRDLKLAGATLSQQEARYLVDSYYQIQDYRKAAANQKRALTESGEPHSVIAWLLAQMQTLEGQIQRALDAWSDQQPAGVWAKSIVGIGPIIAAGLLAHVDIAKAPTAGHIWRFAGLDPTVTWEKKTKRPWNADLKVLCWKTGQSFMKFQNHAGDFYGHYYRARKGSEQAQNAAGAFADQARATLAAKAIGKETEAYKWYSQGMLPPAHVDARARRWVVKLWLSHFHAVLYECHYGVPPAHPYVMAVLGHSDMILPPNWPMGHRGEPACVMEQ